tara:strand:- start:368 stop:553 length:186 start_codon:yes stop_codon:yes gene_type:complete
MTRYIIKKKSSNVDLVESGSRERAEETLKSFLERTGKNRFDYCIEEIKGRQRRIVTEGSTL